MLASDLSPMALAFVAVCGSSAPDPDDTPLPSGLTCNEYNLMIKVEFLVGDDCNYDDECDQVIPVDDSASCPTADRVVSNEYDASYLFDMIEEAEGYGCTVVYPGDRGDCDADSEPVCYAGQCRWM